ncbi:E3 ubiquitin-protein ligase MARCH6 [Echinococcus granulosus]|uniref:RING-type E3 ubiquitin transferase n=1 Tax=Echinococcus granulosus TaxID=6210 RepID=A0A068WF66_ECHGR|nr:E3 ubiquitin-protein ligase MARCH6 [Echinococcus granulosus]CDS18406.1 E3 ubiquitin protein ligase MARCH6 [Echinococcus granulosus]
MPLDDGDFCRVCRCEGTPSQPLFYPCMCTGSIKYVHQDCLVQWLQYSKRQTCELCNHRFTFKPVYAPHTPSVVPLPVLFLGLLTAFRNIIVRFFHLLAVVISWLFVVPLTVCRIYRCFFSGNLVGLLSLPLDILSTEHVIQDCIQGFLIVLVALTALFGCVWLREQLMIGGEPDWLADGEGAAEEAREGVDADGGGEAAAPNQVIVAGPVAAAAPANNADNQAIPDDEEEGEIQELALPQQQPPQQEQPAVADGAVPPGGNNEADFDAAAAVPPLTLERIFGLDGTMTFLEHVLWIIVLNILFILFFASFPFFTGRTVVSALGIKTSLLTPPIELILFSFIGYIVMATLLIISHYVFKAICLPRSASYYAGLCYIYIKVPIIAFAELGIFTAFCGLWIDACSLGMFNASVAQRLRAFNYAPVVFSFIHWTMGLMYLFYVSSLFIIIRDVIRPGVLWFLPDFTDPDYRPVQDMISLPVTTYIQRLVVNLSLTGIIVILSIWLPTLITQKLLPGFLPFQMSLAYDSPVDYSVEIIILQIVMPFLLDGQFKVFLSALLRNWCAGAAWMLGLRSYLLGDVAFKPSDEIVMADGRRIPASALSRSPSGSTDGSDSTSQEGGNGGDGSEGENAAAPPPPTGGYAPYARPRFFVVRLFGLLVLLVTSLVLISLAVLVVPVALGRLMLGHMGLSQTPHHDALTLLVGVCSLMGWAKTVLCLPIALQTLCNVWYILVDKAAHLTTWEGWRWLSDWTLGIGEWLRGNSFAPAWARREALAIVLPPLANAPANGEDADAAALHRKQVLRELLLTLSVPLRLALLSTLLLVILPASLGLLINLVVFIPAWIGPEKTLAIGFSESWIFGVMHMKVWMLILLVGPRWQVRDRLEEIHDEILHNWPAIRVFRIIRLSLPLFAIIGLSLSFPFLLAYYLAPHLNVRPEVAFRYVYPLLFGLVLLGVLVYWQMRQCIKLYEQIKDAEYLIGRRLVNYGDADSAGKWAPSTSAEMGTQTDNGLGNEIMAVAT